VKGQLSKPLLDSKYHGTSKSYGKWKLCVFPEVSHLAEDMDLCCTSGVSISAV
jgi:hypothetical protein